MTPAKTLYKSLEMAPKKKGPKSIQPRKMRSTKPPTAPSTQPLTKPLTQPPTAPLTRSRTTRSNLPPTAQPIQPPTKRPIQPPTTRSIQPLSVQSTQRSTTGSTLSNATFDEHFPVHRFFHLVNYRSWNQIEVFHRYREPSRSAECHATKYKSDLERISSNSGVPAPLRKVASNLTKKFKIDEFVAKFEELSDAITERKANMGVRDHRVQPKERQPKDIETTKALVGDIESPEAADIRERDVESDIEETETEGVLESELEGEAEVTEAPVTTEDHVEEMEVAASLPTASRKRTRAQLAANLVLRPSLQDTHQEPNMEHRTQRFQRMDQTKFWKLASGRTVEEILFEKSIEGGASYKIRSYTIDYDCDITRKLFSPDEWTEIMAYNQWELPNLKQSTWDYLNLVCIVLQKGGHPATVAFPADDWSNCNLILRTALAWMDLYRMKPCPLLNPGAHSEAFWARNGWPVLKDLLNDIDGITMLDGEKSGLESTQHKNKSRRLDIEVTTGADKKATRKAIGSKYDLVARDTLNHRDWCVGEAKKEWDEQSTEHLRHTSVDLFKKLRLISIYRCKERDANFKKEARFFSFFSGGNGFKAFQLRPCSESPYVSLFHEYQSYALPPEAGDWVDQFAGLWFLLRVKIAATQTIDLFNRQPRRSLQDFISRSSVLRNEISTMDEHTLASSPLGPD